MKNNTSADAALDCAARDLDLLDESICDLVVAIGGSVESQQGFHQQQLQRDHGVRGFREHEGSQRLLTFRNIFQELELPIPSFLQVLHLHLRRGAALLKHCPDYLDADASAQANNRASGDVSKERDEIPIVTSLKGVTGLTRESLLDIVEGRNVPIRADLLERMANGSRFASHDVELFCRCYLDPVMDLYEGVLKRVSTFDVYDCIRLRCFFINLDHILSMNGIRHVQVRNEIYGLILKLLRFALRNAWWIRNGAAWLRHKLPFMFEVECEHKIGILRLGELRDTLNAVSLISGQHGMLDVRLFRDVARVLNLKHEENEMWQQLMGELEEDEQNDEYIMFKKVVAGTKEGWSDAIMAALVTIANTVLFETFVTNIGTKALPENIVDASERLELLNSLVELLHEIDFGYTAWAVDTLGTRADATLVKAFRVHGDLLLKGDGISSREPLKRLQWGDGVLVYVRTLHRIKIIFRNIITALVNHIAAPVLKVIGDRRGRQLWSELLYSDDKLYIGPKGEVGNIFRGCNKVVRDSICVELFGRIIEAFAYKVARGGYNSEQTIFNALAIWDSFCNLHLGPADLQSSYHINILFETLEKIKMGIKVNLDEPKECVNDFWKCLISSPETNAKQKVPIDLLHYVMRDVEGQCGPENRTWVGGEIRQRVSLFGNLLFFFRDDSTLQPVGMVDMLDIIGTYSIDTDKQIPMHMSMSESDAELYSCGTTETESFKSTSDTQEGDHSILGWGWGMKLRINGKASSSHLKGSNPGEKSAQTIDLEFMAPEYRDLWLRSLKSLTPPRHNHQKLMWWPKQTIFL
ncbi:ATPase, putative [Babesia ovis]|uniref:ATPase, putative n=1 Tax=Babesia ovis TaxID=5869 RepID=A0A9W5TA28_BABOV|nr:ATPase, putative [Babesia ovis]